MVESFMPKTIEEALGYLNNQEVIIIAGGTDLMVKRRNWSGLSPLFEKSVLFLNQIDDLKEIKVVNQKIYIGSMITLEELMNHPFVPKLLKEAVQQMASPAIRHSGTLGGNIANASPAGDTLPVLYVLNAKIVLACSEGERVIEIADFIKGPGKIDRKSNELIKEIILEDVHFDRSVFEKVGGRKADAISKVAFCGGYLLEGEIIKDFRVAFGAVGATIIRSVASEQRLIGKSIVDHRKEILDIHKVYEDLIRPIDDQRSSAVYRKQCSMNLLQEFIAQLFYLVG